PEPIAAPVASIVRSKSPRRRASVVIGARSIARAGAGWRSLGGVTRIRDGARSARSLFAGPLAVDVNPFARRPSVPHARILARALRLSLASVRRAIRALRA